MKKHRITKNIMDNKGIAPKPLYQDVGTVLLFIFLFPYVVSFFFGNAGEKSGNKEEDGSKAETISETQIYKDNWEEADYIVCNQTAAGIEKIPMETYLILRLPATINSDYEEETLKAQAVILRTELLKTYEDNMEEGGETQSDGKHYVYVETNLNMTDKAEYEKCKKAVSDTKGMYIAYQGVPIKAPYFAVSAGATRNGNEVLKCEDYPYLKSVMCRRDFSAAEYVKSMNMSSTAFMARLQKKYPQIVWTGGDIADMIQIKRDRADYAAEINIGGEYISGETFREIFSLSSACFTIEQEKNAFAGNRIIIKTKGIGHGLGFSQFAANEAAKRGSDYIDIINYFFTDIMIEKIE